MVTQLHTTRLVLVEKAPPYPVAPRHACATVSHSSPQSRHPNDMIEYTRVDLDMTEDTKVTPHRQSLRKRDENGTLFQGRGRARHFPHESIIEASAVGKHNVPVAPVAAFHVEGIPKDELHGCARTWDAMVEYRFQY